MATVELTIEEVIERVLKVLDSRAALGALLDAKTVGELPARTHRYLLTKAVEETVQVLSGTPASERLAAWYEWRARVRKDDAR